MELGAIGVSISIFNLVSKMFNLPLLNITTSFVAEDAVQKAVLTDFPLEPSSPVLKGLFSVESESNCTVQANLRNILCKSLYFIPNTNACDAFCQV